HPPRLLVSLCCLSTHPPTAAIYTLSLHDALPISASSRSACAVTVSTLKSSADCSTARQSGANADRRAATGRASAPLSIAAAAVRSEEHTSELQSRRDLVCRLLLEKKKKKKLTDRA